MRTKPPAGDEDEVDIIIARGEGERKEKVRKRYHGEDQVEGEDGKEEASNSNSQCSSDGLRDLPEASHLLPKPVQARLGSGEGGALKALESAKKGRKLPSGIAETAKVAR